MLLGGLLFTGGSVGLRNIAAGLARSGAVPHPALAVAGLRVLLSLVNEIGGLPLGFYSGFVIERRYGLSNQTLGGWVRRRAQSLRCRSVLGGSPRA